MNQVQFMDEIESIKDLLGDLLESWHVEVLLLLDFSVVLGVLIEVVSQKLGNDEQVLFVIEVINHFQKVLLVQVVGIRLDESQQFDLVHRLVEIVFVVLDDLHANHLLSVDVVALNSFREGS